MKIRGVLIYFCVAIAMFTAIFPLLIHGEGSRAPIIKGGDYDITRDEFSWNTENYAIYEEKKNLHDKNINTFTEDNYRASYEKYYYQKTNNSADDLTGGIKKGNGEANPINRNIKKKSADDAEYKKKRKDAPDKNSISYRVNKGDTLYKISKKFNIPAAAVADYNGFPADKKIEKNMLIKIPTARGKMNKKCEPLKNESSREEKKHSQSGNAPKFIWPVNRVTEYRRDGINGVKPIGLIISGKPGAPVLSSAAGVVKKIGKMRGFGKYIIIEHDNRYMTVYSNLGVISVSQGQSINAGIEIGKIDPSDKKLHFQIDFAGKPLNPLKYLPGKS